LYLPQSSEPSELDVARAQWYKGLEDGAKYDAWGQVVEAVDAYERCVLLGVRCSPFPHATQWLPMGVAPVAVGCTRGRVASTAPCAPRKKLPRTRRLPMLDTFTVQYPNCVHVCLPVCAGAALHVVCGWLAHCQFVGVRRFAQRYPSDPSQNRGPAPHNLRSGAVFSSSPPRGVMTACKLRGRGAKGALCGWWGGRLLGRKCCGAGSVVHGCLWLAASPLACVGVSR
jgi:hypothetical protein